MAEPAEATPGETVSLSFLVVDPDGLGVDQLLVWSCTDLGDGCAEALLSARASDWAKVVPIVQEEASASLVIPALLSAVFSEGLEELELPLFILACAPGACPVFEAVQADPAAGTPEFEALAAQLGDPEALVSGLAMDQACLATRDLLVSTRSEAERNHNPLLVGPLGPLSLVAGEAQDLAFSLGDPEEVGDTATDATLFLAPLSTDGTFDQEVLVSEEGDLTVSFTAPDTLSGLGLYAVARDGTGGQAWWRGEVP